MWLTQVAPPVLQVAGVHPSICKAALAGLCEQAQAHLGLVLHVIPAAALEQPRQVGLCHSTALNSHHSILQQSQPLVACSNHAVTNLRSNACKAFDCRCLACIYHCPEQLCWKACSRISMHTQHDSLTYPAVHVAHTTIRALLILLEVNTGEFSYSKMRCYTRSARATGYKQLGKQGSVGWPSAQCTVHRHSSRVVQ